MASQIARLGFCHAQPPIRVDRPDACLSLQDSISAANWAVPIASSYVSNCNTMTFSERTAHCPWRFIPNRASFRTPPRYEIPPEQYRELTDAKQRLSQSRTHEWLCGISWTTMLH